MNKTNEAILQRNREYYWKNRDSILAQKRFATYGDCVNFNEYAEIYDTITNCQCCNKPFGDSKFDKKVVDHSGNYIRGIICNSCNIGIGRLGDNMNGVNNALEYLKRHYGCF